MSVYTPLYGPVYPAAFPQAPLDVKVALQLTAGTWTDITHYAYQRAGTSPPISITRGRPPESSACNAGQATMQWNNRDGRFSRSNPTGPFFGQFGRNTPVRISVPDSGTYLRFADDTTSFCLTADSVALQITSRIDVRIDLNLDSYLPCTLFAKWGGFAQSWALSLNADGTVTFNWFDGSAVQSATSTLPLPNLGRITINAILDTVNQNVVFKTAPTMAGTFTTLGAVIGTGATALSAGATQPVHIGFSSMLTATQGLTGKVYEARIYSGALPGTQVAGPVFTSQAAGATSFIDAQGNTWSLQGSGGGPGTAELSARSYRFHGECSSLPQAQDLSGADIWTPVTGSGILRRLQQGSANIWSAMRRAITKETSLLAYWPCEDAAGSKSLASGIPGGQPMAITGTPALATDSTFACSNPLPQVSGSQWTGPVPAVASTGTLVVRFLLNVPSGYNASNSLMVINMTGGKLQILQVFLSLGVVGINAYDASSNVVINTSSGVTVAGIGPCMVSVELTTTAGTTTPQVRVMPVPQAVGPATVTTAALGPSAGGAFTGGLGVVSSVSVNPAWDNVFGTPVSTVTVGHIFAENALTDLAGTFGNPLAAYNGETAANRFARLCSQYNITSRVYGFPAQSVVMGPQQTGTLVSVLQSCEDADRGMIYEPSECLGLGYRTLASIVNQAQQVTGSPLQLSWTGANLGDGSQVPGVTDDDRNTANDMTVTRNNGSSFQFQLADGSPMSISNPPAGAGDYAQTATQFLNNDAQLPDAAGWLVHLGTCAESRFPLIPLNLARPALASLLFAIQNLRLGDYLQVASPPAWLTPNMIRQIVTGTTEELGGFWYKTGWQCAPETPYETGIYDDLVYGRADTDGSTLTAGVTSGATSLSVATTNPLSPLWTTAAADFPFDISIGGEQVTVTNITGATSPQTFTVTRSVNGVVKAQAAGADVRLFYPPVLALT